MNTNDIIKDALQHSFEKTDLPNNWQERIPSIDSVIAQAEKKAGTVHSNVPPKIKNMENER